MIKVLLVGPHWFGGLTESTAEALKKLNCKVEIFYFNKVVAHELLGDANEKVRKKISGFTSWLNITPPHFAVQMFWALKTSRKIDSKLVECAKKFMPEMVLVLKGEMLLPETLRKLKDLQNKPVLVNWWVDNPIKHDNRHRWLIFPHCVPLYDHVFLFDRSYFKSIEKLGAKKITFLPCAADPDKYHPVNMSGEHRSRFSCNVCFIASYYKTRGELIAPFLDTPGLNIWGGGWSEFLGNKGVDDLGKIVRGEYLQIDDVNIAYQAAQFVLNSHHPQSKRGGLNSRAFEIPASGGAQLMDYVPEMEDLLKPGEEVVVYRSPEEGAALAKELIKDPGSRNRIAKAGYERVMSEHTYKHRMQAILDKV